MTKAFNKTRQKAKRRVLRKNMPPAEQALWIRLKHKQLNGFKFRRQYSVKQYILDFYCPEAKLGIEVDGPSHFYQSGMNSDSKRSAFLKKFEITLLRFTNTEIYENMNEVIVKIMDVLPKADNPKPPENPTPAPL